LAKKATTKKAKKAKKAKAKETPTPCDDLSHLTAIGPHLQTCRRIDDTKTGHILLGGMTALWLPVVAGLLVKLLWTDTAAWYVKAIPVLLLVWQILASLVAQGAAKCRALENGSAEVLALRDLLSWMHHQIFSNDKSARLTIMVPDSERKSLGVFLRPAGLPSRSETRLACECNANRIEGAAGISFCRNLPKPTVIDVEVVDGSDTFDADLADYAAKSAIPVEVARGLSRRARFYFAVPLGGEYGNPIGVLVADNLTMKVLADGTDPDCQAAHDRVKFFASWIATRLAKIPVNIRERIE
jgi:hypothetical protein